MTERLASAVVRIWGSDDRPAGVGFLVGPNHVLTAAHVLESPNGLFELDFPLITPGKRHRVQTQAWQPVAKDGTGDIAGLELLEPPPPRARPAPLSTREIMPDRHVAIFGFPEVADDGMWSIGRLRGRQATGWYHIDSDPGSQIGLRKGFSGAPVWDTELGAVLGMVVAAHRGEAIRAGYMHPVEALLDAWPELRKIIQPPSPYPGLRPFDESDAEFFHGRSALTERVVQLTKLSPAVTLLGPSGGGKSSLVKAGVLPRLRSCEGLVIATLRPSEAFTALHALALAFDRLLAPDRDPLDRVDAIMKLADQMERGGIATLVEEILRKHGGRELLVLIDQFEEALDGDELLPAFGSALQHGLGSSSRMRVLLTLRADFLGVALQQPAVAPLMDDRRTVMVGELNREELREAVTGPVAELHTVWFENGLVDRILDDVGLAPGRLPLLQFALRELWEHQRGGVLGHQSYEDIGQVDRALANRAEQLWDSLSRSEQDSARRLLGQLVRPAPDSPAFSRRAATRDELDDEQWAVAQRLVAARLLVVREVERLDVRDSSQVIGVELAHEALVTHWDRLAEIERSDREFRLWQEDLRRRIAMWRKSNMGRRRLLGGADYRDARRWLDERPADLSAQEKQFIEASGVARRKRWRSIAIVTVVAVGVVATGWYSREATFSNSASVSLAERARNAQNSEGFVYESRWLSLRSYRSASTTESREQLRRSYEDLQSVDRLIPNDTTHYRGPVIGSREQERTRWLNIHALTQQTSGDGSRMVTTFENRMWLWSLADPAQPPQEINSPADSVTLSRSGRYLLYQQNNVPLPSFRIDGNKLVATPQPPKACAGAEQFYCVYLRDLQSGKTIELPQSADLLHEPIVAIDPDDKVVAVTYLTLEKRAQVILLYDVATGKLKEERELPQQLLLGDSLWALWLSPGGTRAYLLETLPRPGTNRVIWKVLSTVDFTEPELTRRQLASEVDEDFTGISLDGRRLYTHTPISENQDPWAELGPRQVVVWDVATGNRIRELRDDATIASEWPKYIVMDADGSHVFTQFFTDRGEIPNDSPPLMRWSVAGNERQEYPATLGLWTLFQPLGNGEDSPIMLLNNNMIGLALPRADQPPVLRRLSWPDLPFTPNRSEAEDFAGRMCQMLYPQVIPASTYEELPAGTFEGQVCS